MKKRNIAITGQNGFIGTHLLKVLGQDFEIFGWDLQDKRDIFELQDIMGVDTVIHLAALTNVQESIQQPSRYFWTNAVGTSHMIELAVKARARFIYVSSAAVAEPDSSPYAYSKWVAEQIVEQMQDVVRGVILRPENVYGKGMNPNSIMSRFLHDDELTIYGDGTHTRDFINVVDVVRIIRYALETNWQNVTLDVGTGKKTSVNQIAKWFEKYSGKKVVHLPALKEIASSKADTKKLKELYPFQLVTNIQRDIAEMVAESN